MSQTLKKSERIKSKRLIDSIFRSGNKILQYPLLLFWMPVDECPPKSHGLLFGVSVSKRKIRGAVQRNLMKRRIREAYRLQKSDLLQQFPKEQTGFALFYVYIAKQPLPYRDIERAMGRIQSQLVKEWQ